MNRLPLPTLFAARRALLLLLVALAGCTEYLGAPPPQETRGGFTVLVDAAGQPTDARVVADIAAFAQRRGFVHQPATPERYLLGNIELDVTYDAAHLRVVAFLHTFSHQLSHKFIDRFYQDFHQEYAARYGDEDPIFENDYMDDASSPPRGGGGSRGAGSREGGGGGGGGGGR